MDIARYEGTDFNLTAELSKYGEASRMVIIEKFRKIAEKGAMTCPFCYEKLGIKAGPDRVVHFSHGHGRTCLVSKAYTTYRNQTARENKNHSVIKETIYTEFKSQEVIKPDMRVEYGYIEKANEQWRYYPDIYLRKSGREFAVSVITNVNEIGDKQLVRSIKNRNEYFAKRGLEVIWFVEDRELAEDFEKRVLHMWEVEYALAIKTEEDLQWERFVRELKDDFPSVNLFDLFSYKAHSKKLELNIRSLYYVHSLGDNISFSVYRMILDKQQYPFRAFALSPSYKLSLSDALIVRDEIQLSDKQLEEDNRVQFGNSFLLLLEAWRSHQIKLQSANIQTKNPFSEIEVVQEKQFPSQMEGPYSVPEWLDIIEYIHKLRYGKITESEVKLLYNYLKLKDSNLENYGLTKSDILVEVNKALGFINSPGIRKWLVEIEYI